MLLNIIIYKIYIIYNANYHFLFKKKITQRYLGYNSKNIIFKNNKIILIN